MLQSGRRVFITLSSRSISFICVPYLSRAAVVLLSLDIISSLDLLTETLSVYVSAYRTNDGKPWVLPVVRRTEQQMAENEELNHEYLPVMGLESFSSGATGMLLGSDSPALAEGRAFGVQTLSGTGALKVGADFLHKHLKRTTFYFSSPTWGMFYCGVELSNIP